MTPETNETNQRRIRNVHYVNKNVNFVLIGNIAKNLIEKKKFSLENIDFLVSVCNIGMLC